MPDLAEDRAAERPTPQNTTAQTTPAVAAHRPFWESRIDTNSQEYIDARNRHNPGLIGKLILLADEDPLEYIGLIKEVNEEYNPQTPTEKRLVQSLIQHYWMMSRAVLYQNRHMEDDKKLALYMRYQATHERSYYRAQKELQQIQKERAKQQIGFEQQKREAESHDAKVRLAHAKAQTMEVNAACRKVMEAPMPGNTTISFERLAKACSEAIAFEAFNTRHQTAAAAESD